MDAMTPALAGHKGLRGEILLKLKMLQPLAAKELARVFGVSANAIRRHLKELEAEGLIVYGREQRGTGAPTFAYQLSRDGEALFPNHYEQALTRLIGHVIDAEGREAAVGVAEEQFADLRRRLGSDLQTSTPMDRLRTVAGVMEEAGFMADSSQVDGETRLSVHNCALLAVATCLPEVCDTELHFLEDALGAQVRRRSHIIAGCNACEYVIDFGASAGSPPMRRNEEWS